MVYKDQICGRFLSSPSSKAKVCINVPKSSPVQQKLKAKLANMAMKQFLPILCRTLVPVLLLVLATQVAAISHQIAKPGCLDRCGSVYIPYPFGTEDGCYLDDSFLVNCNGSDHNPPRLFFPNTSVAIINISPSDGELRVASPIARACYDKNGNLINNTTNSTSMLFTNSRFSLSSTRNKFTAVGCDTVGVIEGKGNYTAGCLSLCNQFKQVKNGSCGGLGCCQTSIQEGVVAYATGVASVFYHKSVQSFNPCGYSFVAEDTYKFSSLDLANFQNRVTFPVVFDWSVGNDTCEAVKETVCRARHSYCVNSTNGGYFCKCSEGFEGNPYLLDGCHGAYNIYIMYIYLYISRTLCSKYPNLICRDWLINKCVLCEWFHLDVNECEAASSPCTDIAKCTNLDGSFKCSCPEGYEGDGRLNGTRCNIATKNHRDRIALKLGAPLGRSPNRLFQFSVPYYYYF